MMQEFIQNGYKIVEFDEKADAYVVNTTDNKEVLIPVTKECVIDVNVDEKEVRVHLLPGLLDIYLGNDK